MDLTARATAVTDAAAAKQAALLAKQQAIATIKGEQIQAVGSYYTGLGAAQADLANAQAIQNIQRFQDDLYGNVLPGRGRVRDVAAEARRRKRKDAQGTAAAVLYEPGHGQTLGNYGGPDRYHGHTTRG
jgi:hypothetical protein